MHVVYIDKFMCMFLLCWDDKVFHSGNWNLNLTASIACYHTTHKAT